MQRIARGDNHLRALVREGDPRLELAAKVMDSHTAFLAMVVVRVGARLGSIIEWSQGPFPIVRNLERLAGAEIFEGIDTGPLLEDISESTALERADGNWELARWRLRRSTHIGGIATDHGAMARSARSTPAPSRTLQRTGTTMRVEPTQSGRRDATPSRSLTSLAVRNAGGQLQRQRQRSQGIATPSLSPRPWPACSRLRTHSEATHARRTDHLHPRIAPDALRLALLLKAAAAAARGRLRRSTRIGGIATEHDATAKAARSSPRAPLTLQRTVAPTRRSQLRATNATLRRLGAALRRRAAVRIARGRSPRQRLRLQRVATPSSLSLPQTAAC